MYLTQINMIRGLTKAEYFQLRELCFFSNCLYNVALYNVRKKFFADKTYLRFEANYHECKDKDNDNYKLLQSNMAQQTLRAVDFAFKSFFGSIGKVKSLGYQTSHKAPASIAGSSSTSEVLNPIVLEF